MAYEKIDWRNQETPLNANNLNHMEDGIAESDIQAAAIAAFEALGWEAVSENVASSMLEFLCGIVGADPSTLATTAKTIVGAINEDHATLTADHDRIRNITISTTAPTSADGSNGDIWIVYQ